MQRDYEPGKWEWVNDQVDAYESSGGTEANTLRETGIPIIIVTCTGAQSGKVRKFALMRVEHEGSYALVASKGGAPEHPSWYHNLVADPNILIQDGPEPKPFTVERIGGEERGEWWDRSAAVFSTYEQYAAKTDREIPVFLATPR